MNNTAQQDRRLAKRIGYTLATILVSTLLAHIPVHGTNPIELQSLFQRSSLLQFSDVLSGGALSQLTVGGFAVTSIIMSGIIIQLLEVIFPKIEQTHTDGELGRRKFDRISLALAIAMTISMGLVAVSRFATVSGILTAVPIIEWAVGTAAIALMAQRVRDLGIGEGATVILAANIASALPPKVIANSSVTCGMVPMAALILVALLATLAAVCLQEAYVFVPVQQTRKQLSVMNAEGRLPVSVSLSNVLPIVYATSIMMLPSIISLLTGKTDGLLGTLLSFCSQDGWYAPTTWQNIVGLVIYALLIVMFTAYSSELSFSAPDISNRMRELGDVIPNVRPNEDTTCLLDAIRRRLTWVSATFLVLIAIVPDLIITQLGATPMFSGTALMILVAAFCDIRLRCSGLLKYRSKKYQLFSDDRKTKEASNEHSAA